MPVDIRLLRYLPPDYLTIHPDSEEDRAILSMLRVADRNEDRQVDETEATEAVVFASIQPQLFDFIRQNQITDPAIIAELSQRLMQQAQDELARRDGGEPLRRAARQFLERGEAALGRLHRDAVDISPLYRLTRTAELVFPSLVELRNMDSDHNRSLSEEEVMTVFQNQREAVRRANPGAAATEVSPEDQRAQAQAFLLAMVPQSLQEASSLSPETQAAADRIPVELDELDLRHLSEIPEDRRTSHPLLRVLFWMHSRLSGGQTVLDARRARELMEERVIDLSSLHELLQALPAETNTELRRWLDGFAPHYYVTESQLERYLQSGHRIDLSSLPERVRQFMTASGQFQALLNLAGDDHIVTREDFSRFREALAARLREQGATVPSTETLPVLTPLWQLERDLYQPNPRHGVLLNEPEIEALASDVFLSRAAAALVYARPELSDALVSEARISGVFAAGHMLADGLHAEETAHASDGLPGVASVVVTGLPALVHSLGNWAFSSDHHFHSSFWWAQWVRNHSDHRHTQRTEALSALRRVMRENHLSSVEEGLSAVRRGSNGELYGSILSEELHLPEMERIFRMENSRSRQEAWLDFSQRLRDGTGLNSHGEGFSSFFLMPWFTHNGPASLSIYNRLYQTAPSERVVDSARSAALDQMGDGGSLFPLFWFRNWADSESGFNGLWDEAGTTAFTMAAAMGAGYLFGRVTTPGNRFAQFVTTTPFGSWRESPSLIRRGTYWTTRFLTIPLRNSLFPRVLQGEELERAVLRTQGMAERAGRGGLWGFIQRQRALLQAHRIAANPETERGASQVLRIVDEIAGASRESYEEAARLARRAAEASDGARATTLTRQAQEALERADRLARVSHEMQLTVGIIPESTPAGGQALSRAAAAIERRAESITDPRLRGALNQLREGLEASASPSRFAGGGAESLARTAATMEHQAEAQRRQGTLWATVMVWAWLYESAVRETDRANPTEESLPPPGIDAASWHYTLQRRRRMRGSRATFSDFELNPTPNYVEAPPPLPPPDAGSSPDSGDAGGDGGGDATAPATSADAGPSS